MDQFACKVWQGWETNFRFIRCFSTKCPLLPKVISHHLSHFAAELTQASWGLFLGVLVEVPLGRAVDLAVVEVPDKGQVVYGVARSRGAALWAAPIEALDLGRHQRGLISRGVFGELFIDPQLAGTGADGEGNDRENGDGEKVQADLYS